MRSVHESPLAYSRHPYSSRSSPEMDPSFGPEQFSRPFPPIIFSLLRVYFYDSIKYVTTKKTFLKKLSFGAARRLYG